MRGSNGWSHLGGVGGRRPNASDEGARPVGPSGRRAGPGRLLEQVSTWWTIEDLLELGRDWKIRELLSKYDFPGDDIPIIRGSAALPAYQNPGDEAANKPASPS